MDPENKQVISGFIVDSNLEATSRSGEDGDDHDDEDDDAEDFMDMEDVKATVSGAFPSKSMTVRERKVRFYDERSRKFITVKGAFLFTDSWWYIEATIYKNTNKVWHAPRYRVKNLWNLQVVTEYLNHFHMGELTTKVITDLMKMVYKREEFTVKQVLDLQNFEGKCDGFPLFLDQKAALQMLQNHLSTSGNTALIRRALDYPDLFWSLQTILPKKALSLLICGIKLPGQRSMRGEDSIPRQLPQFDGLNTAISESPWEFGFSQVLRRKYNVCSCAAKLQDLQKSGVFEDLNPVMKDNLIVHDKLQRHCLTKGHTFSYCPTNNNCLLFHECENRTETQRFLCSDYIGAAKCEPRNTTPRTIPALYLRRYWTAEKNLARQLTKIVRGDTDHAAIEIPPLDAKDQDGLDSSQQRAVDNIRTRPLTILSGMGGCGKTTVVSKIVEKYRRCNPPLRPVDTCTKNGEFLPEPILLTAPTGKAASLLGKKCGMGAFTIHSVIYSHLTWSGRSEFPWVHADTKMLIVDECSMVAVTTIERLLDILLRHSKLSKLVLVGDIRQLPSVEPGNFFEDVFKVALQHNLGVDLKTNHRVDAGGRIIVDNAGRISQGKMPQFDEETLDLPRRELSRFHLLEIKESSRAKEPSSRAQDHTLDRLRALLEDNWDGIKDETTSQIITFTKKLVANANSDCCFHYNQHYPYVQNKKEFRPGDKVCCRKNCNVPNPEYVEPAQKPGKAENGGVGKVEAEHEGAENGEAGGGGKGKQSYKISNGETFIIKEMTSVSENGSTTEKARLDDMEGNQFWVDFKYFRNVGKVEHAWCRTIHTFQGSEMRVVIYLLSGNKLESWRHVYTAVTRGQQEVVIIGTRNHLKRALETEYKRDTGLSGFFSRALGECGGKVQEAGCSGMDGIEDGGLEIPKSDQDTALPVFIAGIDMLGTRGPEGLEGTKSDQDSPLPVLIAGVDVMETSGPVLLKGNRTDVNDERSAKAAGPLEGSRYDLMSNDAKNAASANKGRTSLSGMENLFDENYVGAGQPNWAHSIDKTTPPDGKYQRYTRVQEESDFSPVEGVFGGGSGSGSNFEKPANGARKQSLGFEVRDDSLRGQSAFAGKETASERSVGRMETYTPNTQFRSRTQKDDSMKWKGPVEKPLGGKSTGMLNKQFAQEAYHSTDVCTPRANPQFKSMNMLSTECGVESTSSDRSTITSIGTPLKHAQTPSYTPSKSSQFKLRKPKDTPITGQRQDLPPSDAPTSEQSVTPKKRTAAEAYNTPMSRRRDLESPSPDKSTSNLFKTPRKQLAQEDQGRTGTCTPKTRSQFRLRKAADKPSDNSPDPTKMPTAQEPSKNAAPCTPGTNSQFKLRSAANNPTTEQRATVKSSPPHNLTNHSTDSPRKFIAQASNIACTPRTNSQFQSRRAVNTPMTKWRASVESPSPDKLDNKSPDSPVAHESANTLAPCTPSTSSQFALRKAVDTPMTRWRAAVESPSPNKPGQDPPNLAGNVVLPSASPMEVDTPSYTPGGSAAHGHVFTQFKKRSLRSLSSQSNDVQPNDETDAGLIFPPSQNCNLSPESQELEKLSLSQTGSTKSSRKRLKFQNP